MVNYNESNNLNEVFSALSDPTRRAPFEMSLPAISKHLKVLENSGLVSQRKNGRFRYYFLNPQSMRTATEWINHWSRFWTSSFSNLDRFLQEEEEDNEKN